MASDAITVLLFARYAELLGQSAVSIPATAGQTVGSVVDYLRRLPGGSALPDRPFVAVNMEQAAYDRSVSPADEIALLPPMAGG